MLHNYLREVKQKEFWRRILQSEIRNSAAAEKTESESEGGQKFLPPNPLPFCPPERSVSAVPPTAGAINRSFVQNRFELRSAIATKFRHFENSLIVIRKLLKNYCQTNISKREM